MDIHSIFISSLNNIYNLNSEYLYIMLVSLQVSITAIIVSFFISIPIASILSIILRYNFSLTIQYVKTINSFIAHIGVGVMIIGITCSSIYQKEYNFNLAIGDEKIVDNEIIKLEKAIQEAMEI